MKLPLWITQSPQLLHSQSPPPWSSGTAIAVHGMKNGARGIWGGELWQGPTSFPRTEESSPTLTLASGSTSPMTHHHHLPPSLHPCRTQACPGCRVATCSAVPGSTLSHVFVPSLPFPHWPSNLGSMEGLTALTFRKKSPGIGTGLMDGPARVSQQTFWIQHCRERGLGYGSHVCVQHGAVTSLVITQS